MHKDSCKLNITVSDKNPHVHAVIKLVENDIRKDWGLRNIAKVICVSPGYLSRLFRIETGIRLTEYVNIQRVLHGKNLLETTDEKISQVAIRCGIDDYNYFCRLFKRYIGVSPSQYRKLTIEEKEQIMN